MLIPNENTFDIYGLDKIISALWGVIFAHEYH